MKIVLRADASAAIGSGHIMRQLSLAEELLDRGSEVTLVGEINEADWLTPVIQNVHGLRWVQVSGVDSERAAMIELRPSTVLVDSYSHDDAQLAALEKQVGRVAVILDGPWQRVSGSLAIAPVLDPTAEWLEAYEGRFVKVHAGPDYVMLRRQILEVREGLQNPGKASKPEITLALGGTDSGGNSEWVIEALKSIDTPLKVTVFAPAGSVATEHRQIGAHEFVFRKPGSAYASTLTTAALVIAAGGTSALELIYLGLPSIFLPVAENQYENAAAIEKLGLGALVWPKDPKRQEKLVHAVTSELRGPRPALIKGPIIDGHGVGRVADLLLEAG